MHRRQPTQTLLAASLAAVTLWNLRLWRRDAALAARVRQIAPAPPPLSEAPRVSVLVAAWNEREQIGAHLASFAALDYPQLELVICAGGPDGTFALAQRHAGPRVTVLEQRPGEGKQRALARCYAQSQGAIIVLTDADCRFDQTALRHLLAPLIAGTADAASGTCHPLPHQRQRLLPHYAWVSQATTDAQLAASGCRTASGLLGMNAAVTRAALDRSGGMSFPAPTGTDYQLAQRLLGSGARIAAVPESSVAAAYPETLSAYRRRHSRWLKNLLIYGPQYGAHADVRATARTVALGALMLLAPLAALLAGPLLLVVWLALFSHSVAAKLRYALLTARLHGVPPTWRLLAALPLLTWFDFLVWATPLRELLSQRGRTRW